MSIFIKARFNLQIEGATSSVKDQKSGFVLPQIAGLKIPFLSGRADGAKDETEVDGSPLHEETRRATEEILSKVGFEFPAEFAHEPEEAPPILPETAAPALRFSFKHILAELLTRFHKIDMAAFLEHISATTKQLQKSVLSFFTVALNRIHKKATTPLPERATDVVSQEEPLPNSLADAMPKQAFPSALISGFRQLVEKIQSQLQDFFNQMRLRFKKEAPIKETIQDAEKTTIPPDNDAGALDNLLEGIAMKEPAKKAFSLQPIFGVFVNLLSRLRSLPKPLLLLVCAGVIVLFAASIFLSIMLAHPHHSRTAMLPRREPRRTSIEHLQVPRQAQAHKDLIVDGQSIRPSEIVSPVEEDGSGENSSTNDAAVIASIRPQIANLCGLRVSKVLRWQYHQGYLFCYIHSATRDMSTVLEHADNGTFTLIGGSNGLMTFDQMTNLFMVDPDIAKKLLAK